jgi:peptidoglycan-associated lipoprotein
VEAERGKGAFMVTGHGSVVLIALVLMVTAGCAAQSGTNQSPTTAAMYGASDAASGQYDGTGTGTYSQTSARPRLRDFVSNGDINDIHFDFDSYDIRPMDAKVLEASVHWLKTHPDALLVIEGHADERGTGEYNVALGERRAKASMNYMVSHGIQASRITVMSYGEERNVCREKMERCWSKNRRAHFLVKAH